MSLGVELVHVECDAGNVASRRIVEKNGGRLEREEDSDRYFLLPTDAVI